MLTYDWTDLTGFAAATLTTVSFVPQAWRSFRTRETGGVSLAMYALFACGVALWLAYGVLLGRAPIIIANAITLGLTLTILVLLWRARGR